MAVQKIYVIKFTEKEYKGILNLLDYFTKKLKSAKPKEVPMKLLTTIQNKKTLLTNKPTKKKTIL